MRQILIQYPDGEFHTVNVTRFYSIVRNNEESFVVEYDDLTTNKRNYFSVLEKQSCLLEFAQEDCFEVALGAASMMLQKLFTVPDITEIDSRTRFDWDFLFSIAKPKK